MTANQLNKQLDEALVDYIKDKGFVSTGSLYKSINFSCKFNKESMDLKIKFKANDYIKYLEKGSLVNNFLQTKRCISIIENFMSKNIENLIAG